MDLQYKMETVVVAGGFGLVGKMICRKLAEHCSQMDIVVSDPQVNNLDLLNEKDLDLLFKYHNIVGYVNASYPKNFYDHTKFFMETTKSFAERMKSGSIVNLASIYGMRAPDDELYIGTGMEMPDWYAAAKGAIIAYSRCLAVRYAPKITINCISPGGVYDGQPQSFVNKYVNKVPMKRMVPHWAIGDLVIFLLSKESDYITGQNIILDGGLTAKI